MKIRGTFLKDYVKIIRGTRDKDWEKFLTEEDWEILDSMILPTEWYPGETMGRIADGLYELLAGSSVAFVRGFGKSSAPRFFEDVTGFLVKNDISSALNKWRLIADRYIDVVSVNVDEVGENVAKVSYFPIDGVPSFITFREVQAGNIEWLVEANGVKNAKSEFLSEKREGKQACIIKVVWE